MSLRTTSTLALLALTACVAAPPPRPTVAAAPEPLERPDPRRYDAPALSRVMVETTSASAQGALRERALAAHDLAELARFAETVALEGRELESAEQARERRRAAAVEGLRAVEAVLATAPADVELLWLQGELHAYLIEGWASGIQHGKPAREALRAALALEPGHAPARLAWAKQYYYVPPLCGGDPELCARLLQELVEDAPGFEPAWSFLGQVLRELGRANEARTAFQRALALDPSSPRARHYLGVRGVQQ